MNMALTAYNGDNETKIGLSKSLSYSLYDQNKNEIEISKQQLPIKFWIPKDTKVQVESYKYINASQNSQNKNASNSSFQLLNGFLLQGFRLSGLNISIHIQLKPVNKSIGYLILLKFGDNPIASNEYFDEWRVFCPTGMRSFMH